MSTSIQIVNPNEITVVGDTTCVFDRQSDESEDAYAAFRDFCYRSEKGETPYDWAIRVYPGDRGQVISWAAQYDWQTRRMKRLDDDLAVSTKRTQIALAEALKASVPLVDVAIKDVGIYMSRLRRSGSLPTDPAYVMAIDQISKLTRALASMNSSLAKNVININAQAISANVNPNASAPLFSESWSSMQPITDQARGT